MKKVLCALLVIMGLGMVALAQGAQAQVISWDALFVTSHDSHYKAFYQTLPLWQIGSLTVEGGMGVTAWRFWSCYRYCGWHRRTYPSLLARARLSLFTAPTIDIYSISWLSVSVRHRGKLLPEFPRADFFTAVGIDFQLSADLDVHGELGFPIGWGPIPPTIAMGFSWRF